MNIKTSLVLIAALVGTSLANAGEYLVKYKNAQALNNIAAMQTEAFGMQVTGMHKPGQLVKVVIGQQNEAKTLAKLMTDKNIQYVVPNIKIRAFEAPVDPVALKEQYALAKVNAAAAWAKAGNKGSRNVLLAVIDTGVDYKHKNLAPNTVPGYDFRDNDADPMDLTGQQNPGHGTHCAGIIGASGLIDGGIQGLSPEVSIMPIRFLGADGSGELEGGIKSIDYAIEHKVQVISASWGASVPLSTAQPLVEAIARAEKAGIIFVAAAANDGKNNDTTEVYPANANVSNMITVAASNSSDAKPSWSNYGKAKVHVAAPGDAIMSTLPGDKYGNLSGTSMATPLVAGLVAFLKAQDASLTAQEIRALLQTTGAKVNIETACNCRVDALAAVTTLIDKKAWLVPAAGSLAANQTVQVTLKNGVATSFTSSNPAVLTVDEKGLITGVANGSATITATDAAGVATTSLNFYVGKAQSTPPPTDPGQPDPGQPGEPGGECPIQDPAMCQILCQIMPDAPWCTK